MRKEGQHFVLCVSNRGFPASLVVRGIYRMKPDPSAAKQRLIRVIDESGEDYLYPMKLFVEVDLPKEAGRAFRAAS